MDIYELHANPEELYGYDLAHEVIPDLVWDVVKHNEVLMSQYKYVFSHDPYWAYKYAARTKTPFPEGEKAIATDLEFSLRYAKMLGQPFPAGEKILAIDPDYAYEYVRDVLDRPFPEGEEAIATRPAFKAAYDRWFDTDI